MKKLSLLTLILSVSLQLGAAQDGSQPSRLAQIKNYLAALLSFNQASINEDCAQPDSASEAAKISTDSDEKQTLGDYYFKYGLVTITSLENALLSKIYLWNIIGILNDMQNGNCFNAILYNRGFDYSGIIDTKNLSKLPVLLRIELYFDFQILNDERFNITKSEKEVVFFLMEHKYRFANPDQKKVLQSVIRKLESASQHVLKNDVAVPLVTQAIADIIQKGADVASENMMGIDILSPFRDTIASAIKQQTLAYFHNNKKFNVTARGIGESLLTDICYMLAKYKLDHELQRTYGFTCKYPWSKRSNVKHYLAGNFIEGYARHEVKNLMRNYLIKPCISAVFGKPVVKRKETKKPVFLWEDQPRSHE